MKLLIIEDERKTAALLREALLREQYEVHCVFDGEAGHAAALVGLWDAMIVDIMLPGMNGLALVASLRARRVTSPVLMLSARGGVDQRVEGLDAGADDYLPKPLAMSELFARLRSLVRRGASPRQESIELTDLVEVYIRRLREKIDRNQSPPVIHTVRGLGYAMHPPHP